MLVDRFNNQRTITMYMSVSKYKCLYILRKMIMVVEVEWDLV